MEILFACLIGILFGASVYLMLGRNLIRFLFGLILMSNAANMVMFTSGRLTWGAPALVPAGMDVPPGVVSNALPQALVLTAIVIGFGLLAFAMVLVYRSYQELGTVNTDAMRLAEPEIKITGAKNAPIRKPEEDAAAALSQTTAAPDPHTEAGDTVAAPETPGDTEGSSTAATTAADEDRDESRDPATKNEEERTV